jgi:hypothetical protein
LEKAGEVLRKEKAVTQEAVLSNENASDAAIQPIGRQQRLTIASPFTPAELNPHLTDAA